MIERHPAGDGGVSYRVQLLADEASFVVEVGVDRSVARADFLAFLHPPKYEDVPIPSSEWLVRLFYPVVEPASHLLPIRRPRRVGHSGCLGVRSYHPSNFALG